ncbi:MAG TPA: hypothetical protein VM183_02175 [Burkholderiales bacterium]|nr:hypothetical protein [Burkholderiales bacterium]
MHAIPVGQALLQKVVAKVGIHAAAAHLEIPASILNRFLEGEAPVPDAIVLRAVDIVLADPQRYVR